MAAHKRPSLKERALTGPLLFFSLDKEIKKLKAESKLEKGDRNAITLQKSSEMRVVLISMRKGASLNKHKVEGPITLFVLSGKIQFIAGESSINLSKNGYIVLEETIKHDVVAKEDALFLLTIIQPK
ncbi:MAG TPA: hypothetical protein PK073_08065 [Ignavibacteriaceae bacterium]|jgi:quercetin dioxygenase-like cupin family protein|nr:MAG: hypothetical protein BWY38_00193 [Ignavibacteria bacterium ADurb.Bin266]OQY71919.1 MAG: hypothetical protein B6D44_11350 [Ignavibacteriales bacterium UTCHB2]HQF42857.1 hypothetical protein [Ignavibacteriaceae bacterium]HQI39556.1 hypothetical protein [Ignavibacteriaceae bacterium]HQJ45662.1 hypothetical protein [Ignavibacteriaceae bacterium]